MSEILPEKLWKKNKIKKTIEIIGYISLHSKKTVIANYFYIDFSIHFIFTS